MQRHIIELFRQAKTRMHNWLLGWLSFEDITVYIYVYTHVCNYMYI